jgi:hypothetical protein
MPDARELPELARSLRSLGAAGDDSAEAAHGAIFLPLLEARTRATGAPVDEILCALRGDALSARIEALAVDAAVQGIDELALARALTAQAGELMEPLRASLLELDARASNAAVSAPAWDAWVAQLRRVFAAADVACRDLAHLVAIRATKAATPRWFERSPR